MMWKTSNERNVEMRGITGFRTAVAMMALVFAAGAAAAEVDNGPAPVKVGDVTVTLLSDGESEGKTSLLIDASDDVLRKYAPEGTYASAFNAFLVRTPDKTVLVDTGFGRKLFDNLKALGVAPEQVDIVLLTHMHGDHTGGLLRDGKPAFPNAKVYVAEKEYDYWAMGAPEDQKKAVEPVAAYDKAVHPFEPGDLATAGIELIPGIRAVAAYGHTPGHTLFMIDSKDRKLLIWGDIAHAMAVQMPVPDVAIKYDVDPRLAVATRKAVLEYVAKNKIPVAGMHIPGAGIGTVSVSGEGYAFTPLP